MKKVSNDNTPNLEGHIKKPLLKVMREKCIDCSGYDLSEVRLCEHTECSLWPYRMGKNPFHTRKMSEKQKKEVTKHLKDKKEKF